MGAPGSPLTDSKRLSALQATGLLDSPPEEAFDRLTRLVMRVLGVPVALVTLVDDDRQFFKSCVGLPEPWATKRETPLTHSFCQYTVTTGEPLVIEDAREHPELRHNLAIPDLGVVAYAGIPLRTVDGHTLGTFCAIDTKPRQWSDADLETLRDLAASAATEIELRVALETAREGARELEQAARRLRLLAETGRLLSASLDVDATLNAVARLALPQLADMTMLDVIEDGSIRRFAATHTDDRTAALFERARAYPPTLGDGGPQSRAINTGRSVFIRAFDEARVSDIARSPEHAELIRGLGMRSLLVVPLLGRDEKTLGTLSFVRVGDREPFDDSDCDLGEEIARRAALALENARLYEAAQRATRARDDMLGVVSHDLRNPIHSIYMGGSFLLDLLPPEGKELERTQAAVIKRAAERANRLIQDLLDITHIESGRLSIDVRPYSAASLVDEAIEQVRMQAAEQGITLVRGEVDGGMVHADRDRVLQALGNLLGNAIKFTPRGGRVTVFARVSPTDARFAVSDSGSGIPNEHLPHLFDRYWQASRKDRRGVGLGLSIVKGIAEAHGGEVRVETAPGAGSTFTLVLSMKRTAEREPRRPLERPTPNGEARL
jgi:signal transduction histidine kinase